MKYFEAKLRYFQPLKANRKFTTYWSVNRQGLKVTQHDFLLDGWQSRKSSDPVPHLANPIPITSGGFLINLPVERLIVIGQAWSSTLPLKYAASFPISCKTRVTSKLLLTPAKSSDATFIKIYSFNDSSASPVRFCFTPP